MHSLSACSRCESSPGRFLQKVGSRDHRNPPIGQPGDRLKAAQPVVVVLVAYRSSLTPLEQIAVDRCFNVLGRHPMVVVAPDGVALPSPLDRLPVERFSPSCFSGVSAYNSLMLSPDFYRRFLSYRYLLLHQLDVFVFRDELLDWCSRGYDYIGAPWIGEEWPGREETRQGLPFWIRSRLFRFLPRLRHDVGNGGFSLRKVQSMYRAVSWLRRTKRAWGGRNEDGFFSIAVPECWWWAGYRVPTAEEAMRFSVETQPSACLAKMEGRVPFACHGWDKHEPAFWHPLLAELGYDFDLEAACRLEAARLSRRHTKQEARRLELEREAHARA